MVRVNAYQNATLLEITYHGSNMGIEISKQGEGDFSVVLTLSPRFSIIVVCSLSFLCTFIGYIANNMDPTLLSTGSTQ